MTKPRRQIFKLALPLFVAAAAGVIAQDWWDDESLFASEQMTMEAAVTGTLPEASTADTEDLFGGLFGEAPASTVTIDEPLPQSPPAAPSATERDDAFDAVDAPVAFADDLFDIPATPPPSAPVATAEPGITADDFLNEMFATGDRDAVASPAIDPAALDDLFGGAFDAGPVAEPAGSAPAPAAGDDFDDLFGDMISTQPTPAVTSPAVVAVPAEPVPAPAVTPVVTVQPDEKGVEAAPAAVAAPVDDFDDLFGELVAPAPVATRPAVPAAPAVVAPPAAPVATAAPAQPATAAPAFRDELALGDDAFSAIASQGRRAAQTQPPGGGAAPVAPRPANVPVAPAPAVPAPAVAQPVAPPIAPVVVETTQPSIPLPEGAAAFEEAERLRRVAREHHAVNSLERAESALEERDFMRAITMFQEALRALPQRADLEPARARARRGLAESHYRQAGAFVRMGQLEEALSAAQGALRHGHPRGPDAVRRIQQEIEKPVVEKPVVPPKRWEEEDFKRIDQEIEDWLRRGREAYLTGEYEKSILAFESVLARDPENKEAIRMIRAAGSRQYDRSTMELDSTRERMMAAVRDTWNPRQYGIHERPTQDPIGSDTTISPEDVERQLTIDKMRSIRIPEIAFRQDNIRDVLGVLQQLSVDFDPSPRAERTGVNIILQLDAGRGAQPQPPQPAAIGGWGGSDFGGGAATAQPVQANVDVPITFRAMNISLEEALNTVVGSAGLKYRIRGNMVIVVPADSADGDIIHRWYDVLPTAIDRLRDLSAAVGRTGSNQPQPAAGFLAMDDRPNLSGDDADIKGFFEEMGVQWPARSSIKFVRGIGKLVVANTQENLAVFERILSILNVVPFQVEIEARFVEVAQTDIDSLGLEWMLTDNWQIAEMAADADKPLSSRRRIQMQQNSATGGFTAGNRYLPGAPGVGPVMDSIATVGTVLTNPELSIVLHALQQRGHTDLLSAPKVTTQSGVQANIRVVTEYIYPTAFDVQPIAGQTTTAGGQGGSVGAVVTPQDFETREVGVILEVLPTVSPEGQMISLELSPEVVTEPTWRNYGSTYTSFDQNGNMIEQTLNMEQPFFHSRRLRTSLLIYNGATVVMGGMITELRNSVDDKIPFLGDIPVIGRLFRSKYDHSEKRNLLIFVTARLVDPAGRPLDQSRVGIDRGIAERIVNIDN
jgi:general secretion pathway protein D